MSDVIFEDFSIKVIDAIDDTINAALEEAAGELESEVKRNTRVRERNTANSFRHTVDDSKHIAYVGSDKENSIWEEFGTGEYALNNDGRKGYWVFVKGSDSKSKKPGKSYTLNEARRAMFYLRSKKGLEAYYTKGKKPSRAFWKAYTSKKSAIINLIQNKLKGL